MSQPFFKRFLFYFGSRVVFGANQTFGTVPLTVTWNFQNFKQILVNGKRPRSMAAWNSLLANKWMVERRSNGRKDERRGQKEGNKD